MSDKHRMNEITLPWPPKSLSPNARVHWAVKSKFAKAYRMEGFTAAHQAGWSHYKPSGDICMEITFHEPDKRYHRDHDNMMASIKSGLDGVADALHVNDNRFRLSAVVSDEIGGFVKIRIAGEPK